LVAVILLQVAVVVVAMVVVFNIYNNNVQLSVSFAICYGILLQPVAAARLKFYLASPKSIYIEFLEMRKSGRENQRAKGKNKKAKRCAKQVTI